MLFNSYEFILLFLPLTLIGFFSLSRLGHRYGAGFLALASLFFYGYWSPAYVALLLGSIGFNYLFGAWIADAHAAGLERNRRLLLTLGIAANLGLLAYYKYSDFFVSSLNAAAGTTFALQNVILPLGISFFTFTQVAFLVDAFQGKVREYSFVHYVLFVTYFPHLIAGPVLHHGEMMPQFARPSTYRPSYEHLSVGMTIFFIGLFKKVVLADGVAEHVEPVFSAHGQGLPLSFVDAWAGALSYALQLYFDFSGYSDMAIGLSRMFGIRLPLNFASPYKAANIIEFWRRWHMTLSRFLRDYLYIPLGGNRLGSLRRYLNLLVTMVLGGLWHGAGWTFVAWGALHGVFLILNHGWRNIRRALGQDPERRGSMAARACSVLLTFLAVTVAWVLFRAESMDAALTVLRAMFVPDLLAPERSWAAGGPLGAWLGGAGMAFAGESLVGEDAWTWILLLMGLVWLAPNTQEIMHDFDPAIGAARPATGSPLTWRPGMRYLVPMALVALYALLNVSRNSQFLYFQF